MKRTISIIASVLALCSCAKVQDTVCSPDGRICVKVGDEGYSVYYDGNAVLENSVAQMQLADGRAYGTGSKVVSSKLTKTPVHEHITAPFYRQAEFDMDYNTLTLKFDDEWSMIWYVCDEGAAYRFVGGKDGVETIVSNELADFNFVNDSDCWINYSSNPRKPYAMAFEGVYEHQMLSDGSELPAFMPVSVGIGGGSRLTILESDLKAYPGMFARVRGTTVSAEFAGYPASFDKYPSRQQLYVTEHEDYIAKVCEKMNFPWRVLAISEKETDMPVNNMVYALAEPSKISDTSWIKPGFAAWEWWNDWGLTGVPFKPGINMETYRYYIDFASANGLEYMVLDEGWSTPSKGDILTSIDEIDVKALVDYAAQRNVKIWLWTVFNCLDEKLEDACKKYSEMGVAGFKVDFLDRNDQTAVEMIWRIAECAARYHLMLDYHGIFPPTGICRTYPNVVNYESIHGEENMKWITSEMDMPALNAAYPFLRMMEGYADYTPGGLQNVRRDQFTDVYSNPLVQGTRAQQVALYLTLDSPFSMLCDTPSRYMADQATTDFICSLPRNYDKTLCLDGKIGEYVVMARKAGDDWYVAGTTNWDSRELSIDLSVLGDGEYEMECYLDGEDADIDACSHVISRSEAKKLGKVDVRMAQGGGFLIKLKKNN